MTAVRSSDLAPTEPVPVGAAVAGCYNCEIAAQADVSPAESIYRSADWRVAHAFDSDLPGWLVVAPIAHLKSMGDLTPAAAAELGKLLRALSLVLQDVVGATKTYVMFFAEAEGFSHLHVHVVPRMPDQPVDERGPRIFARLGAAAPVPADEVDGLSERLRHALATVLAADPV